ncbi:hypothetical protein DPMN_023284 [Dreissena polymorpha]|uniref:Uncharacterized protein n=1 Tax=Dreissena polymorpha TaxID=45954 RepID=A0A9D4R9S0_DREPO|nr:hypothetical protein DPMN_023284 [Dreissena polymorpha]
MQQDRTSSSNQVLRVTLLIQLGSKVQRSTQQSNLSIAFGSGITCLDLQSVA